MTAVFHTFGELMMLGSGAALAALLLVGAIAAFLFIRDSWA